MARPGKFSHIRKGPAPDIGDGKIYDSGWERDIARFLQYLTGVGAITGWGYEEFEFSFQGLGYRRGPFTYRPDFVMRYADKMHADVYKLVDYVFDEVHPGRTVYLEVKGQETGKDRNKWRRFRKHTDYPLEIVKRDKMLKIQELQLVPNWESRIR